MHDLWQDSSNLSEKRFLVRWLTLALALHIIAAVLSTGYYHWDEHFQIYEFLNYRLGKAGTVDLPIEFRTHIRPWLQIAVFAGLTKLWRLFGNDSPFDWAFSFRLFSGLIGWVCTVVLAMCTPLWFREKKWQHWAVILLCVLWYIPALHVRPSSENWGGALFFIGLGLYLLFGKQKSWIPLVTGFLFGLSFESRYQMALMIAGALAWFTIFEKSRWKALMQIFLGFSIAFALGTWADYWGYGEWTFAPWNYVKFNLLEGHVNDIDTFPWWDFYRRAFTEAWPLLGGLTYLSFTLAWIKNPKHLLTWCCVPFILVHMAIGHKELRFVFPVAIIGPILLLLAIDKSTIVGTRAFKWVSVFLIAMNTVALGATTTFPAWVPVGFYKHLYEKIPPVQNLYYIADQNPYKVIGIPVHYYRPDQLALIQKGSFAEILDLNSESQNIWVFHNGFEMNGDAAPLKNRCRVDYSMLPLWIRKFHSISFVSGLMSRMNNWELLECSPKISAH